MKQIRVSHEKPPIYDTLSGKFGVDWDKGVIIAYDGIIYSKETPPPQKIIHENIHLKEQDRIGNDAWWRLYLESTEFRKEQEILAYKAEADFIKKYVKHKEAKGLMLLELSKIMASSMYGNMMTEREAYLLIK